MRAAKFLGGNRLQIVFLLKKEPMSEKQLAGCMDEDEQGVAAELCVLQAVGLVSAEKEGMAEIVVSAEKEGTAANRTSIRFLYSSCKAYLICISISG